MNLLNRIKLGWMVRWLLPFCCSGDPDEVIQIQTPTEDIITSRKELLNLAYPLTIADGEAYQKDLQKHGKKPWSYHGPTGCGL